MQKEHRRNRIFLLAARRFPSYIYEIYQIHVLYCMYLYKKTHHVYAGNNPPEIKIRPSASPNDHNLINC